MGGFKWYPGASRRFDSAIRESLAETAVDVKNDLVASKSLPHGEDTNGKHEPGLLQASTQVDLSQISKSKASIVSDTEYAGRLYYHPDFTFDKGVNSNARAFWFHQYMSRGKRRHFAPRSFAQHMKAKVGK